MRSVERHICRSISLAVLAAMLASTGCERRAGFAHHPCLPWATACRNCVTPLEIEAVVVGLPGGEYPDSQIASPAEPIYPHPLPPPSMPLAPAPHPPPDTPPESQQASETVESVPSREGELVGYPLTLTQARSWALEGNLDLRNTILSADIARQAISEEQWKFETALAATITHLRIDPPSTTALITNSRVPSDTREWSLTIDQPLPTGGSLRVGNSTILFDDTVANSRTVGHAPTLTFAQPLLRGAGIQVNTASIRIAELNSGIADFERRFVAVGVLGDVERAYWRAYAAQREWEIALENQELAARQVRLAEKLADAELVPRVDILRAEAGLYLRSDTVIRAETNVRLAQRILKQIMQARDLPVESLAVIRLITEPAPVDLTFDRQKLVELALSNRADLAELQLGLARTDQQRNLARNQVRPQVDLIFQGRLLGEDGTFTAARRQAYEDGFYDVQLGLAGELPLAGNQSARSRLRQTELRLQQGWVALEQRERIITQEVYDGVDVFEQNWRRIVAARRAVDAAEKAYRGEVIAYEAQQRTSDQVLFAATTLAAARSQLNNAETEYHISAASIAVATGTMLTYAHVIWPAGQ